MDRGASGLSLFEASQVDWAGHLFPSGTLHVRLPFNQQHVIQSTPTPGCHLRLLSSGELGAAETKMTENTDAPGLLPTPS